MNLNNRVERIKAILDLLNQGYNLSTPSLVERFNISKKIIQTDFKDFILPLLPNETIYYDYSSKTYKAKNNFLSKTLFNSKELAIIAVLKNKSTDKYSDHDLKANVDKLFFKFEKELSNQLYSKSSVEKIDKFQNELIQLENAIENKNIVKCFYNNKYREIYPLKILNLEGYWYLIVFEPQDKKIKTFHLNTIKKIEVLNANYKFDKEIVKTFDNAITAYYKPENEPITVELFIDATVSRYFLRKPLNPTQRVIKKYDHGSLELEIIITDLMEIIPTIQRYIPFVGIITPDELKIEVKNNIDLYLKRFE
ncbi:transcriptional regulator, YafY family [Aliarcobacter cibarius]|uniref:Transcriptional regulator, YafY family n=1 Tax=Aliarcobacter cibarius TaxID=255507 RepID=A0A7L5JLW1_9BACT|nr:WYL domain-containing transcriptional regulator [Aliarcobacter cibarius]QKJ26152.1 transcriptional regulator, YafY family [Aliarcobacter cibarius]